MDLVTKDAAISVEAQIVKLVQVNVIHVIMLQEMKQIIVNVL